MRLRVRAVFHNHQQALLVTSRLTGARRAALHHQATLDLANTRGIRAQCHLEDTVVEHRGHRMEEDTASLDMDKVRVTARIRMETEAALRLLGEALVMAG